jgi:hypothetical protein
LYRPWEAVVKIFTRVGMQPGRDYTEPIIRHAIAREVALEAFARMKFPAA